MRGLSQVLSLIFIKLVFPCARQPWEAPLKGSAPPPKLKAEGEEGSVLMEKSQGQYVGVIVICVMQLGENQGVLGN